MPFLSLEIWRERLDDLHQIKIVEQRANDPRVKISINDLRERLHSQVKVREKLHNIKQNGE